jgi:hypothetical protein
MCRIRWSNGSPLGSRSWQYARGISDRAPVNLSLEQSLSVVKQVFYSVGGRAVADGAAELQSTVPLVRRVFVWQRGVGTLMRQLHVGLVLTRVLHVMLLTSPQKTTAGHFRLTFHNLGKV